MAHASGGTAVLVATVSYDFLSNQEAPLSSADQKESNGTISQARALKIGFAPKFMVIYVGSGLFVRSLIYL